MENKETKYQQYYSMQSEVHVKDSRLYEMGSRKKWGHLRQTKN